MIDGRQMASITADRDATIAALLAALREVTDELVYRLGQIHADRPAYDPEDVILIAGARAAIAKAEGGGQ